MLWCILMLWLILVILIQGGVRHGGRKAGLSHHRTQALNPRRLGGAQAGQQRALGSPEEDPAHRRPRWDLHRWTDGWRENNFKVCLFDAISLVFFTFWKCNSRWHYHVRWSAGCLVSLFLFSQGRLHFHAPVYALLHLLTHETLCSPRNNLDLRNPCSI